MLYMLWGSSGLDTWTTFFPIIGGRAPGYQLSPDHFQRVKRMLTPNWSQTMLCIIVPNRLRAIPEFSSWAGQHISIRNLWEVPPPRSPIQASVTISAARKHKISHLQLHIPDNKSQRDFPVVAVCDFYQIKNLYNSPTLLVQTLK